MAPWRTRAEYLAEQARRKYTIVSVAEARRVTGLEPGELAHFGAELLTRQYADGRREEAIRVPREFFPRGA